MTTEPELPLVPVIRTRTGKCKISSLRPGDHISPPDGFIWCVLQSSAKHARIEVFSRSTLRTFSQSWVFFDNCALVGTGKRRRWHALLPAWLAAKVCPFSRP